MFKKILLVLVLAILPIHALAESLTNNDELDDIEVETELGEETLRFDSNQFTQPEKENKPLPEGTLEGFTKVTENDQLALYVQEQSLAIKIQNKETGYIWHSGVDNSENYRLNNTWTDMVQSALTIDYLDRRGNIKTESILTEDTAPEIHMNQDGFTAVVDFRGASIEVELTVTLEEDSIVIDIPNEGVQDGTYNKIVAMKVYPFLGAAHMDDITGYLFIPDGSGALMRFERSAFRSDTPFVGSIYGEDEGFTRPKTEDGYTYPTQTISVPVYGAVHGVKQNAFITSIEEGQSYGRILAYPSGASTDFFWTTSDYQYRFNYFQPTSKSMGGFNVYQEEKNDFNIKQKVMFLSDEEADYVGMANRYQKHLEEEGTLTRDNEDKVDVRLELLGGETKKGLIWNSVLPMTELQDIPEFVEELEQNDVDNLHVVLRGWTKGGLTGTLPQKFPLEKKLGSKGDLEETIRQLEEKEVPFYLHTDFTTAFDGASGFAGSKDISKKINGQPMTKNQFGYSSYYLSPSKSLEIAKKDAEDFEEHGVSNIAIETTGSKLFSDFNKGLSSSRAEMISQNQELFAHYQEQDVNLSLYRPNNYAWGYMDKYLDMPMYSSNYMFVTDTVPFLQVVLKGYSPYYATFSNFSHNPKEEVLRMIEFGAYPSFYLTKESAQLLMKTPSRGLYTSEFDIWKEEVIRQYALVKDSLGKVENSVITDRIVHKPGVSEVVYENGVSILVNYTDADVTVNGTTVEATSYEVTERGN